MTLIAGFLKDGCPILMGDLLLSARDDSNTEIVFPTIGKIFNEHLSKGEYRPISFCQKVNLLSPKLAVAWTGTKRHAENFMRKVIADNIHNNPSRDSLRTVFNGIGGPGNLSIIGIYRNGKEMCIFDFDVQPIKMSIPGFKWLKVAGSGSQAFLDVCRNLESDLTSGQLNKLERGISAAVILSTALLSQEIVTILTLQNLFGAGYEILHPLGSDLVKFCGMTYLFWKAEEEEHGNWKLVPFPFLSSNYSYYKDILVIRCVRFSSGAVLGQCKIDSDELHAFTPVYKSASPDNLIGYTPTTLNSKRVCNIFLWKNCNGETGAFATYGHYATESPPVIWKNEFGANEGIDINMKFVQSSISKVASYFKGIKKSCSPGTDERT